MRFDPYQQVEQVRNAYRQGAYNIANSGGLSQGQRMKMMAAQNNNYMYNMAKLYGDANDVNNKYRQAYAQALLQEGSQDSARQQQALAQQQQAYREAIARRLLGMENANQGRLNLLGTLGKNLFQQQQYNATQDYNNKLLDLYNKQIDLDKYAIYSQNNVPANIQVSKPIEETKSRKIYNPYGNSFEDRLYLSAITGGKPIYDKKVMPMLYLLSRPDHKITQQEREYRNWRLAYPDWIRDNIKDVRAYF